MAVPCGRKGGDGRRLTAMLYSGIYVPASGKGDEADGQEEQDDHLYSRTAPGG